MKFKKSMLCLLGVATMALPIFAGCTPSNPSSVTPTPSSETPTPSSETPSSEKTDGLGGLGTDRLKNNVELTMSVKYEKAETLMKFGSDYVPYTDPAGNTYTTGEFKPTWKAIQNRLNIKIDDVTEAGKIATTFTNDAHAKFKKSGKLINIDQGNASDIVNEGTANHTILDLSKYLDKMPNFKKFLADNPIVDKQIRAADGSIYYAPYFDGYDDMEKTLLLRKDWVEKLLDGDYDESKFGSTTLAETDYTRFNDEAVDADVKIVKDDGSLGTIHKKYAKGNDIITKQNALAAKNGKTLVKALRDYIDSTYNNAYGKKRSELFIGGKAAYNVDELVALYRCVKTNPKFLIGGDATDASQIYPLIPREAKISRAQDLHNFMLYFGLRGMNSRQTYFYVGNDGNLVDVRDTDAFGTALDKMQAMYKEGLILTNYTSNLTAASGTENFSNTLLRDRNNAFSEYDYVQTQTIQNSSDKGKAHGLELVPVMPAGYDWDNNGAEYKYTDSWRGVKTQGWFITSETAENEAKLDRALYLFDYMYSPEGDALLSFGPAEYGYISLKDKNKTGRDLYDVNNYKTITYMGTQVPEMSDEVHAQLMEKTGGNYTNYMRRYPGATLCVGYVKLQGMEYQTVDEIAKPYLDVVETGLANGAVKHPNALLNNKDHMLDQMPSSIAYNASEASTIADTYKPLTDYFSLDKTNKINDIIIKGWAKADTDHYTDKNGFKNYIDTTLDIGGYDRIISAAWKRM